MREISDIILEIENSISPAGRASESARTLAVDYASWCRSANDRLRKCLSLFRKRQIQEGLAVAQEAPTLIALIDRLKFDDLPKWLSACRTNGWAIPQEIPDAAIGEVRAVIDANVQSPTPAPAPAPQPDHIAWEAVNTIPVATCGQPTVSAKPTSTATYLGWGLFVVAMLLVALLGYGWNREVEENRKLEGFRQKAAQADAENNTLIKSSLEVERQLRQLQNTLSIQSTTNQRLRAENDAALQRLQHSETRVATLVNELDVARAQLSAMASNRPPASDRPSLLPPKSADPGPTTAQEQSKPSTENTELNHWQGDKLLHPTLLSFDTPEKADELRLSLDGDVPAEWRVAAESDGKTLTLTHKASSASFTVSLAVKRAELCGMSSYSRSLKTYNTDAARAQEELNQLNRSISDLDMAIRSLQRFARTPENNRQLANRVTLRQSAQDRSKQLEMMVGIAKSRIEAMEGLPELRVSILRKTSTSPICTLVVNKNDLR